MRKGPLVLLVAAFLLFAASACGGGDQGGGGSQDQEGVDCGEQAKQEQAEGSTTPAEPFKAQFPSKYTTKKFQPAFTASIGEEWAEHSVYEQSDFFGIELATIPNYVILLNAHTVYDAACGENIPAPSDLTGWFQRHPYLETSDPTPVTVGGVSGKQFGLTTTEVPSKAREDFPKPKGGPGCSAENDECIPTLILNGGDNILFNPSQEHGDGNTSYPGQEYRVTVLDDVAGETVVIVEGKFSDDDDPSFGGDDKSANKKFPSLAKELISTVEWKDEE